MAPSIFERVHVAPVDQKYLQLIESHKDQLTPPTQSSFRVVCALVYEDWENQEHEMLYARFQRKTARTLPKLFLTSDSDAVVPPGTLCSEFLFSYATGELPIYMNAKDGVFRTTLEQLLPFPPLFAKVQATDMITTAKTFAANAETVESQLSGREWKMYQQVLEAMGKDARDELHPLRLAAGVLFQNGKIRVAWQHKILEFGSSLDPILKLIPFIEKRLLKDKSDRVVSIVQVDQFGNLHAPFAAARAYFAEYNFHAAQTIVHDHYGQVRRITLPDLVPASPTEIASSRNG